MQQIEIVGMRKNRDLKIVIAIIILAIIGIFICTGIILYNKNKLEARMVATNAVDGNSTSENILVEGNKVVDSNEEVEQKHEVTEEEKNFINAVDNIYNGEEGKRAFLTFDDGPTKEVTPHILDILDKYNIKATFFVLGTRVKQNPDILKRAYESGHYIANHGYSHKYSKIYESVDTILEEYNKTEDAIREALGNPDYRSHLFRFPGGSKGGPYEKIKK